MTDNEEMPSIFDKHRTTDDVPLLTCGLKYDKNNYEEKVNDRLPHSRPQRWTRCV